MTTIDINAAELGYDEWRAEIEHTIEQSKLRAVMGINQQLLQLYWTIGHSIIEKQNTQGWGKRIIPDLSADLSKRFPTDRGYSERNLRNMRDFAEAYPQFPIWQVPLAKLDALPFSAVDKQKMQVVDGYWQVPLTQITWYHHISLLAKVKDEAERAFYITMTAANCWSCNVMLANVANGYVRAVGQEVNNFDRTLPDYQSDLARYAFKDPYNFGFVGSVALQNELDMERQLTDRISDFLLEMGKGFAFIGRQYHLVVDGDDYYVDLLMYHLRLRCYVVVELKAVEFIPEFVSKLNFYISAVDEYVKAPEDKPTIGLLLCRSKSNTKAAFSLRGFTQPMGIAEYETEQLLKDVASALPQIEDIENE